MQYLFYWFTHLWLKILRDRFVYVYMHFFLLAKTEMNNFTASFFELTLLILLLIGQLKNFLKYWLYVSVLAIWNPLLFGPRHCLISPKALFRSKLQDICCRRKNKTQQLTLWEELCWCTWGQWTLNSCCQCNVWLILFHGLVFNILRVHFLLTLIHHLTLVLWFQVTVNDQVW